MELKRALRLSQYPSLAFVGAGGKTTAMFQVARQLGTPLIVCATAHLALAQTRLADEHLIFHSLADTNQLAQIALSGVILITGPVEGTRTTGLSPEIVIWMRQFCGYHSLPLLIEADGARQLPLKAPAEHEPALPPEADTVFVVAGLTGVGRMLTSEHVHRPELFSALSGLHMGAQITPQALTRVLLHPNGGLKNMPIGARRVVLLNQADTPTKQAIARSMAAELLRKYDAVLIGSLQTSPGNVYAVHEPIAGVILAAGAAQRFGQPKQLLDWRGKPLVWHVAQAALQANISPVIVVGGEHTLQLRRALAGLPVEVVHNPHWQAGQHTSVQCGLGAVSARGAATLFLLADQPQVSVSLIRSLTEIHARRRPAIVGPMIDSQRSNPVLFDRETYAAFATLSGDQGARQLFSRFPVEWMPWYDDTLALDIDIPEDFQRLQQTFGGRPMGLFSSCRGGYSVIFSSTIRPKELPQMAEQQKKIIIIEDEPDTVEMYSEMMRLSGHEVLKLYEASSALDLILAEMPDAIVLDVMMPVVSGLDLLRELRAAPELVDIPVIVVSAMGLPQDIQAGFDAGASVYLTKPVTYQELSKAVLDILDGDSKPNR